MSVPVRDLQQRFDALAHANKVRAARAQVKRDLKRDRTLEDGLRILADPPMLLHTMKVETLLLSLKGIGRTKANEMLRRTGTSPSKTLAGLSFRQRDELLCQLELVQTRRRAL